MIKTKTAFWAILGVVLLASVGCSTGGGGGESEAVTSSTRNLITEADLEGMDQLSAYEAIRRLKPTWLRYRGQSVLLGPGREGLRIYVDGTYFGDAETLGNLRVQNVQEIRFLDARQATLRFGTGHTVGAILITSRRDR